MADRKSWAEIFLMPVVVTLVGFAGTYFITREQENSARIAGDAQIKSAQEQAAAERQIKILDIFSEKITNSDTNQRILALKLLRAIEPNLAAKLALAVSEVEAPKSEVKRVAQQVATESARESAAGMLEIGDIRPMTATVTSEKEPRTVKDGPVKADICVLTSVGSYGGATKGCTLTREADGWVLVSNVRNATSTCQAACFNLRR